MATEITKKFVPGAPPPAPLSKTQKKKRKASKKDGDSEPNTPVAASVSLPDSHAAALTEKAPEEKDVKSGSVAVELVAQLEPPKSEVGDGNGASKSSPVVELLNKRLKAIGKKITRIHMYSSKPTAELNDDQKKTLATLPSLEAVRKELEETKKAVEVLEAEEARDAALARAAAEEAERHRFAEVIATAQRDHAARAARALDIIRLQSLLTNADPSVQALNLVEAEINAIYASANALLAQEAESKHSILNAFLLGEGEVEGVSFGRLLEILDAYLNPPAQEEIAEIEQIAEAVVDAIAETEAEAAEVEAETIVNGHEAIAAGAPSAAGGLSFRFMQESELESDPVSFENSAEWVEKEEGPQEPAETDIAVSVEIKETSVSRNAAEAENGALNWADDEGELPSIDGLHATFGTSGSATPAGGDTKTEAPNTPAGKQAESSQTAGADPNGSVQPSAVDNDGFVQARGSRARGRGRGFRGGDRGGFRGDRGGFRGGRGGRGRPNHGSESNSWRVSGEGEQRGRGRGRGRGVFDRERGASNGPRGGRGSGNNHINEG